MATVPRKGGGAGGGDSAYEKGGDARCLFWSHLGCSGQNAIMFSHEDLVSPWFVICFLECIYIDP